MDLSVVRYMYKWVYYRNTNIFKPFSQFKPPTLLCFFQFSLVLSWRHVGIVNSFAAVQYEQRKVSLAPIKTNCKDFYIS